MKQPQAQSVSETSDVKIACAARHESGHIVIAAAQGLGLRPEGIIVDSLGEGLACYCRETGHSDDLRKRVLLATFAGYFAEKQFREQHGYAVVDETYWFLYSCDGREARQLLSEISTEGLSNGSVPMTQIMLQTQSKELIGQHWDAVETLANCLLAKPLEEWKPLKSGTKLSSASSARYLPGNVIVDLLKQFRIQTEYASGEER